MRLLHKYFYIWLRITRQSSKLKKFLNTKTRKIKWKCMIVWFNATKDSRSLKGTKQLEASNAHLL